MIFSQGVLNGKVTRLNGDDDKFKLLVADMPREVQVVSWTHHKMIRWLNRKKQLA